MPAAKPAMAPRSGPAVSPAAIGTRSSDLAVGAEDVQLGDERRLQHERGEEHEAAGRGRRHAGPGSHCRTRT